MHVSVVLVFKGYNLQQGWVLWTSTLLSSSAGERYAYALNSSAVMFFP